ncbi:MULTISPECIES: MFS transporter [Burkholderia]|uniref:MFS transporter n=1 Tax=Burkholderia TaxID=32008 RepID=UPI00119A7937|nr:MULTISPECIES: MFS transporter [Burkholderia]MDN7735409.1 MFS transporter [Burkholderia gladioli]TWC78122.1 MHS family proline/betaine transporter-like MFS transporter [Burkholderia sp. SJZ089]TWD09168.1 MHS family proline/betaine transporter-like MFS transporter [Burkholderia sp. SJZ115]TWD12303.1 MHS family proline/betaine transporter-like MFS transporter [Burkholderia sp. SJZ091]
MSGAILSDLPRRAPAARGWRAVWAASLGNAFEWFDFTLYGFFAPVIAVLLFPGADRLTALLLAVATFGVGFVMRPVGGIVLGILADRRGRRPALALTALLMALGTSLIACVPTYAQIGAWAPAIVVLARLLQGFSAGGEMGSAAAYLTEIAPPGQRTYYGSWIQSGVGFAILCGALIGTLMTTVLDTEALHAWGWRVPFLAGMLIGPIGYAIRSRLDETPAFAAIAARGPRRSPLAEVARGYRRETLVGISLVFLWTVCTYVLLFYMPTYTTQVLGLAPRAGFIACIAGGATLMVTAPLAGRLADRHGGKWLMAGAAFAILLLAYPMFAFINRVPTVAALIGFQLIFGLLIAGYTGPILAEFARLFPTAVLSTGLSLAYNLAVMLFGGFAPLFITWLTHALGDALAPAFYVMAAALVSLAGTLLLRSPRPDPAPIARTARSGEQPWH